MIKVASILLLLLVLAPTAAAEIPILPFAEVREGMRGTGKTVFAGTAIETFEVEILGTLPDIGPDQSLILGLCSGGPLAETGILAGMSGSPVYVDGKLIGAVAYSWGFSKLPIAGITPIEEMLAIDRRGGGNVGLRSDAATGVDLLPLTSESHLRTFFDDRWRATLPDRSGQSPLQVPLSISGFGAGGLDALEPRLRRAGFLPVQSGRTASAQGAPTTLEAGSAIGVKLVRGDVEMAATGTVTAVDGDRVFAFGHPLFGLGDVDLPLTSARVQALLPSVMQSARIATPGAELGALRQDRASGIVGRLGAQPSMIPVRMQLRGTGGLDRTYSFDVAQDPLLSPLLLFGSLNGILSGLERGFGNATVRLAPGSVIKMADGQDVTVDNVFSGPEASFYGTGIPAYVLHLLLNNTWSAPRIAGVNLILEYADEPEVASIRNVTLDRHRARPGDSVRASVVLAPYRGESRILTGRFLIPEELEPGTLSLHVGGAMSVSRDEAFEDPPLPRDLDQLIELVNQLRRNDRIYLVASRPDSGLLLGGSRLPGLPPSAASLLSGPGTRGLRRSVPRRVILEESIPTEFAVEGAARLEIEVVAR